MWKGNCFKLYLSLCLVSFAMLSWQCRQAQDHTEDYDYPALETERLIGEWKAILTSRDLTMEEKERLNLHVRAIFAHRCYGCHSTSKHKGALVLDTKEGIFAGGDHGPVIVDGSARESELIRRVKLPRGHEKTMPLEGDGLSHSEIETIALWIDQGAVWSDQHLKIFREAEMALQMPEFPTHESEFSHPVDQWIDKYFTEYELDWPEPLSDQQFLRKIYLDLIGLLPSPEDVIAFEKDQTPNKRNKLIDLLLADSVNYTLHWLSFWNDLLRNDYAGTGFITKGRTQISEWLYQALLNNLPYDSIVRQLINPKRGSEGFIQGIKWRGAVNASQSIELQAAQNISQSLLGLNLKCASCHNSFINNVTLQDAYNFAQIFIDTTLELFRCDKPTGKFAIPKFIYPELGEVIGDSLADRLAALADVMVQPANGRLYRTIINRYWAKLLGRGLIEPVDELDNPSWHQDLLDYLAADFRDGGTDLKSLLRQILSSRTYQSMPVNYSTPNQLRASEFIFKGPVLRRLSAEQLADVFSQVFSPLYYAKDFDPQKTKIPAQWIWKKQIEFDRTVLPYPGTRYFRKGLRMPPKISKAEIIITADAAFKLYLNGNLIGEGEDWQSVNHFDVTEFADSENLIAVKAENEGTVPNPAGLLVALQITDLDGQKDTVFSDDSWLVSDSVTGNQWIKKEFDDGTWEKAWIAGRFDRSHWGVLPQFNFSDHVPGLIRASLVKLDPFLKGLGRPVRENVTTRRDEHATLLQALLLTNDGFFDQAIKRGAARWHQDLVSAPTATIEKMYWATLGREPTSDELQIITRRLADKLSLSDVEDLIWSIFLLPEFQFI